MHVDKLAPDACQGYGPNLYPHVKGRLHDRLPYWESGLRTYYLITV